MVHENCIISEMLAIIARCPKAMYSVKNRRGGAGAMDRRNRLEQPVTIATRRHN